MKDSWEKFLLISLGLIVAAVSGFFIFKAWTFGGGFGLPSSDADSEMPKTKTKRTDAASNFITETIQWELPNKGVGGSPLPLFVSIPMVEIDGRLVNMLDPEEEPIRPPVSNKWLMDNNLAFLTRAVLSNDPDDDGYTNLEEWHGQTNPKDGASHPPYANKLFMVSRQAQIYRAVFAVKPDDTRFQIKRMATGKWQQKNFYLRQGETSPDGQIRIDGFEQKQVVNNQGIRVDASVVHVTFLPKGTKHQLIKRIPTDIPTYFSQLGFELGGGDPFYVKEGDTFPLALDPNTKYRVLKVNEDSTLIEYETGPGQTAKAEIKKK